MQCNICGIEGTIRPGDKEGVGVRLVRDHDHTTRMIRGILCEVCNSRLALVERHNNRMRGNKTAKWYIKYETQIHAHLQCNTGIVFTKNVDALPENY